MTPLTAFKRIAFRSKNLRAGIGRARNEVSPEALPSIVKSLAENPLIRENLCQSKFPKKYSDLVMRPYLPRCNQRKTELVWTAAILSLFSSELTAFATLRDRFEDCFIRQDYTQCEQLLAEIEKQFGVSIWLVGRRIQLLHLMHGVEAQKNYLESVLEADNISPVVAFLCAHFSFKSEDAVSLSAIFEEVEESRHLDSLTGDYVVYHTCPYYLDLIEDTTHAITFEEVHPIIDRYQCFLSMIELEIARSKLNFDGTISLSLKQLDSIDDPRLRTLHLLESRDLTGLLQEANDHFECIDAYTKGRYDQVNRSDFELVEISARADLLSGIAHKSSTWIEEISQHIGEVLKVSSNYEESKQRLKKLAITLFHTKHYTKLASFIERETDIPFSAAIKQIDYLHIIHSKLDPWGLVTLARCWEDEEVFQTASLVLGTSPSVGLQESLGRDYHEAIQQMRSLDLPQHRRLMYEGHIAALAGDLETAKSKYEFLLEHDNDLVRSRASIHLFNVLMNEGEVQECVRLAVQHYHTNPSVVSIYPIVKLLDLCSDDKDFEGSTSYAVLLSLAARHVSPRWELKLSDSYELVLASKNANKPSDIAIKERDSDRSDMIYFFRYICVQRIMDDSTAFESVSEIQEERVALCKRLMALDPANHSVYSSEIKSIIREEQIQILLNKVQSSKLYVDTDGVLSSAEAKLRVLYERFTSISASPELDQKTGQISKRLEDLMTSSDVDLTLPSSAKERIFFEILNYFFAEFSFNSAYGLDANISSSIRHGAFEGFARRAFAKENLLCRYSESDKRYVISSHWNSLTRDLSSSQGESLRKNMEKFTIFLNKRIREYLEKRIRIHSSTDQKGVFSFVNSPGEIDTLMQMLSARTTYEDFVDGLLWWAWEKMDVSMAEMRNLILGEFSESIRREIDSLNRYVARTTPTEEAKRFEVAVSAAKTDFSNLMLAVADWFQRPSSGASEPFDVGIALKVAQEQVNICYAEENIEIRSSINVKQKMLGRLLSGMVEIFFIFLQNVARHGGSKNIENIVLVDVEMVGQTMVIRVTNQIDDGIDLGLLKETITAAEKNFNKDEAMKLASKEGGSGLSKIWRILEYDFKCNHLLNLSVNANRSFSARLEFDCSNLLE